MSENDNVRAYCNRVSVYGVFYVGKINARGLQMSIWDWNMFRRKDSRVNHDFDDEDRSISADLRRNKAEITKKKQEMELELAQLKVEKEKMELQEVIDDIKADREELLQEIMPQADGMDGMLISVLSKLLTGNVPALQQQIVITPTDSITNNKDMDMLYAYLQQIKEGTISKKEALKFLDKNWYDIVARIPIKPH